MNQGKKNKRHSPVLMTVDCDGASATSGISGGDPSTFFQLWLQIRYCVGLNGFVSPLEEHDVVGVGVKMVIQWFFQSLCYLNLDLLETERRTAVCLTQFQNLQRIIWIDPVWAIRIEE